MGYTNIQITEADMLMKYIFTGENALGDIDNWEVTLMGSVNSNILYTKAEESFLVALMQHFGAPDAENQLRMMMVLEERGMGHVFPLRLGNEYLLHRLLDDTVYCFYKVGEDGEKQDEESIVRLKLIFDHFPCMKKVV